MSYDDSAFKVNVDTIRLTVYRTPIEGSIRISIVDGATNNKIGTKIVNNQSLELDPNPCNAIAKTVFELAAEVGYPSERVYTLIDRGMGQILGVLNDRHHKIVEKPPTPQATIDIDIDIDISPDALLLLDNRSTRLSWFNRLRLRLSQWIAPTIIPTARIKGAQ